MKKLYAAIQKFDFREAAALAAAFSRRAKKLAITEKLLLLLGGSIYMLLTGFGSLYFLSLIADEEELLIFPVLADVKSLCDQINSAVLGALGLEQTWYWVLIFWLAGLFAVSALVAVVLRLLLPAILPVKERSCSSTIPIEQTRYTQTLLESLPCDEIELVPFQYIFAALNTLLLLGMLVYATMDMEMLIGYALIALLLFGIFLGLHVPYLALCARMCYTGLDFRSKKKALDKIAEAFQIHKETEQRQQQREKEKLQQQQAARKKSAANINYYAATAAGSIHAGDSNIRNAAELGHPHASLLVGEARFSRLRADMAKGTLTKTEQAEEGEKVLGYLKNAANGQYGEGEFLYIAANVLLNKHHNRKEWTDFLNRLRKLRQENKIREEDIALYDEILPAVVQKVDQEREAEFQRARRAYQQRQQEAIMTQHTTDFSGSVDIPEEFRLNGDFGHDYRIFGNMHFNAELNYDQRQALTEEYFKRYPEPVEIEIDNDAMW